MACNHKLLRKHEQARNLAYRNETTRYWSDFELIHQLRYSSADVGIDLVHLRAILQPTALAIHILPPHELYEHQGISLNAAGQFLGPLVFWWGYHSRERQRLPEYDIPPTVDSFAYQKPDYFLPDGSSGYQYGQQEYPCRSFEPSYNHFPQLVDVNDDLCRFGFNSPLYRTSGSQISPPVSPRDTTSIDSSIWDGNVPQKRRHQSSTVPNRTKKQHVSLPEEDFSHGSSCSLMRWQSRKGTSSSQAHSPSSDASGQSSTDGHRPHYAVERRYRSSLNERYASLARLVAQLETVEICQAVNPDFQLPTKLEIPESGSEKPAGKRQSKTTTLSVAIDTIALLEKACARKAQEWECVASKLNGIVRAMPALMRLTWNNHCLVTWMKIFDTQGVCKRQAKILYPISNEHRRDSHQGMAKHIAFSFSLRKNLRRFSVCTVPSYAHTARTYHTHMTCSLSPQTIEPLRPADWLVSPGRGDSFMTRTRRRSPYLLGEEQTKPFADPAAFRRNSAVHVSKARDALRTRLNFSCPISQRPAGLWGGSMGAMGAMGAISVHRRLLQTSGIHAAHYSLQNRIHEKHARLPCEVTRSKPISHRTEADCRRASPKAEERRSGQGRMFGRLREDRRLYTTQACPRRSVGRCSIEHECFATTGHRTPSARVFLPPCSLVFAATIRRSRTFDTFGSSDASKLSSAQCARDGQIHNCTMMPVMPAMGCREHATIRVQCGVRSHLRNIAMHGRCFNGGEGTRHGKGASALVCAILHAATRLIANTLACSAMAYSQTNALFEAIQQLRSTLTQRSLMRTGNPMLPEAEAGASRFAKTRNPAIVQSLAVGTTQSNQMDRTWGRRLSTHLPQCFFKLHFTSSAGAALVLAPAPPVLVLNSTELHPRTNVSMTPCTQCSRVNYRPTRAGIASPAIQAQPALNHACGGGAKRRRSNFSPSPASHAFTTGPLVPPSHLMTRARLPRQYSQACHGFSPHLIMQHRSSQTLLQAISRRPRSPHYHCSPPTFFSYDTHNKNRKPSSSLTEIWLLGSNRSLASNLDRAER
ncbi:uncharacterized protein MYCFIDRAFT_170381 [Pseudocercospora fijiensis CIRAD86]|uniref:BHLH domain-containing protein n=1 Tax=Pseudocercospora fijiensis (strain CIRAD86) TaxID=383855 RepID=N1QAE2_PSEFD|nr:uncharacterized protein MYCFIDRAFT_170381 [Pseudocercospora fijiensis CIRAD86]EME88806.1 hypothetical protein MYCFIDRAFT_170381 [Pseudocercospora fijiensis CIRAD86]